MSWRFFLLTLVMTSPRSTQKSLIFSLHAHERSDKIHHCQGDRADRRLAYLHWPAFDAFLQSSIAEVATLLRKSNRQLRLAAFDCLAASLSRSSTKLSTASSNSILAEVQPLVSGDMDMNLLHIFCAASI